VTPENRSGNGSEAYRNLGARDDRAEVDGKARAADADVVMAVVEEAAAAP
jgi:hypothetical protein